MDQPDPIWSTCHALPYISIPPITYINEVIEGLVYILLYIDN